MVWLNRPTRALDPHCRTCEVALVRDENWARYNYAGKVAKYLCRQCQSVMDSERHKRTYAPKPPTIKQEPTTLARMIRKQAERIADGICKRVKKNQKPIDDFRSMAYLRVALSYVIGSACPICGQSFKLPNLNGTDTQASPNSISVDCFEPTKGYTKNNARFICFECNSRKGDNDLASIKRIYEWMLIGGPDALTPPNCTP